MSLNHRPADESCENVQLRPFKPPDDETRRLSEADQLRAELKAETGYESYIEYLGAHEELREHFSKLQRDLFTKEMFKSTCFILDLSRGVDSQANVSLRYRTSSPAEVLTNLRHPPAESSVQVLLWMVNGVSPDLVSALGLGLNIDPSFFEAVHQRVLSREQRRESIDQSTFEAVPQRVKSPPYGHERPFAPSYAEIGGSIVTTTVSHRSGQPHPVLVVFIAGTDCNFVQIATKIGGLLPLPGNAADKTSYELWDQPQWLQHKDNVGGYAAILHWCLGNENKATDNNINLIFVALLPLAYITALRIHDQCGRTRIFYLKVLKPSPIVPRPSPLDGDYREDKNWVISQLHWNRLLLRRLAEDLEDESEDLIRYLKWQALTDWPPAYSKIAECYQRAHKSAHRMEAEIRDFLQLQAGEMGLQESRKSIEISSLQIEESKRAKLFTVLAFVYVPLNLATSIFGMNIYQLNASGQNLSVFLATALVALFVTGGMWYLIEQVNSYRKWRETCVGKHDHKPTKFTLMTRINMLIWLLLSPHRYWMIKRGIWWCLLTNNSSHLCQTNEPYRSGRQRLTAAEFVSEVSSPDGDHPSWYRQTQTYPDWVWKPGSSKDPPSFED